MVITKERPRKQRRVKNASTKALFDAAAGTETLTGTGLTLLRLVPATFDTTLRFVQDAGEGEVAALAVPPAEVRERLVAYWKDHRQLPMTDRLKFIIDDMATLAKMSADTEQALMLRMIFHSVSDKIQPFMPHAGLRLIYDTAPNEARWALAPLSESKPVDLGENALYVDIVTTAVAHGTQGVGGGSDSVEERKETFLSLLESYRKEAAVSQQHGASEIGPEMFARVVDIGWLSGYLQEYEAPEEEDMGGMPIAEEYHNLGIHSPYGGAGHDHDLGNFVHVAAMHAAIAHMVAEHASADHAAAAHAASDATGAHATAEHAATEHAGDGAAHAIGAAHGIDSVHGAYMLRHADEAHKHQDEWAHEQRAETERGEAENLESEAMALEHVPGRHAEAEELFAEAAGERELARADSAEAREDAHEAEFDRQQDAGFEAMERSEAAEYGEAEYADAEYPERAEYAETEYAERAEYAEVEYAEGAEAAETELAEAENTELENTERAEYAESERQEAQEIEAVEGAEIAEASETAEVGAESGGESAAEAGEAAEVELAGAEAAEAGAGGEAERTEVAAGEGEAPEAEFGAAEPEAAETAGKEAAEAPQAAEAGEGLNAAEPGGAEAAVEAAEQQGETNEYLRSVQEDKAQDQEQTQRSIDEANDRVKDAADKQEQGNEQVKEALNEKHGEETQRQEEDVREQLAEERAETVNNGQGENRNDGQEADNARQRDTGTAEGRYQDLRADATQDDMARADASQQLNDHLFRHVYADHPIHVDQSQALRDHSIALNDYTDPAQQAGGAQDHTAHWQSGWHVPVGDQDPMQGFRQAGLAATHMPDNGSGLGELGGHDGSDSFANLFVPMGATYDLGRLAPAQWPGAVAAKQDPVDQVTRAILQNNYTAQNEGAEDGIKVKPANFGYSFGGNFVKMSGPGLSPSPSEEG